MLLIKGRSDSITILRDGKPIFRTISPKRGGTRAMKLFESLGILNSERGEWVVRTKRESDWVRTLGRLQGLDQRVRENRDQIDTVLGVLSGLTDSVEQVGWPAQRA